MHALKLLKNNKNIDNFFSALEIQFIIDVFQSSFLIIIRLMTKLFYQGWMKKVRFFYKSYDKWSKFVQRKYWKFPLFCGLLLFELYTRIG